MVGAEQKLEHSVGLEVVVRVTGVLVEGEAWLSRTGGIGGLSGSDVVLSGPTEGQDWDEHYQQVVTHSHCSTHEKKAIDTDDLQQRLKPRAHRCCQEVFSSLCSKALNNCVCICVGSVSNCTPNAQLTSLSPSLFPSLPPSLAPYKI